MAFNTRQFTELTATQDAINRERQRLNRRVREAYKRMEQWEAAHTRRSVELAAFLLRFPPKRDTLIKLNHKGQI